MVVVKDDPYRTLNLPHTATDDDIKSAYRQLAKKYHPDTWSSPFFSEIEKKHATVVFQKLSAAYELLSDLNEKAEYDRNYRLGLYTSSSKEDDDDDDEPPPRNNNNNKNNQPRRAQPPPVKPPPTGAPPPLLNGWTTAIDPASGSLYYCHAASRRSSWIHPSLIDNHNHNSSNKKNYYFPRGSSSSGGGNPSENYGSGNAYSNSNSNSSQQSQNNYNYNGTSSVPGKRRFPKRKRRDNEPPQYQDDIGYYVRTSSYNDDDPDNHRCGAFLALMLCPPLGIPACYHSIMVDRCWNQKQEAEQNDPSGAGEANLNNSNSADLAHNHSKIAASYACFGNVIGILFWVYILFFSKPTRGRQRGRMDEGLEFRRVVGFGAVIRQNPRDDNFSGSIWGLYS